MFAKTLRKAFAIPLVLVFSILLAHPAAAAAPVIENGTFDNLGGDSALCGFMVLNHEVGTYQTRSYFDNQGNLQRIEMHVNGTDNFYNPDNPSVVLSGKFAGNFGFVDWSGELLSTQGVPYHITAPGYGTVLVRAGLWLDYYPSGQVVGKNSEIDPKDMQQFCSILAVH